MTRVDSCRNATKRATLGRPDGAVQARGVVRHGARMRWAPGRLARRAGVRPGMHSVAAAALTHRTESGRDAVHAGGSQLAPGAAATCGAVARSGARRGALARPVSPYRSVSRACFRQRQPRIRVATNARRCLRAHGAVAVTAADVSTRAAHKRAAAARLRAHCSEYGVASGVRPPRGSSWSISRASSRSV